MRDTEDKESADDKNSVHVFWSMRVTLVMRKVREGGMVSMHYLDHSYHRDIYSPPRKAGKLTAYHLWVNTEVPPSSPLVEEIIANPGVWMTRHPLKCMMREIFLLQH